MSRGSTGSEKETCTRSGAFASTACVGGSDWTRLACAATRRGCPTADSNSTSAASSQRWAATRRSRWVTRLLTAIGGPLHEPYPAVCGRSMGWQPKPAPVGDGRQHNEEQQDHQVEDES